MKTQTFTPSSKNAGALGGKSYPLSPTAKLEESEIAIRSSVVKLLVFDSADKPDHTSRGLVPPCSWDPPGEKPSHPPEAPGGPGPEALACKLGDRSRESLDRPVCLQVGSQLRRQSQGPVSSACLPEALGSSRDPPHKRRNSAARVLSYGAAPKKLPLKRFPGALCFED